MVRAVKGSSNTAVFQSAQHVGLEPTSTVLETAMLPLHQCHIPDLVNVQVGKTRHGGLDFTANGKERGCLSAPFGRASPSVVNHLTRAGSLLASTSSMYAYSSNAMGFTDSYLRET